MEDIMEDKTDDIKMLTLIPEKVDFQISTTDVEVVYAERKTVVKVEGLKLENYLAGDKYSNIEISFARVAELKCTTLNFFESNYDEYQILNADKGSNKVEFWEKYQYNPDSGFYQVADSEWLKSKTKLYDPQNNLNLKHFLLVGYDSYVELLAADYIYAYRERKYDTDAMPNLSQSDKSKLLDFDKMLKKHLDNCSHKSNSEIREIADDFN
jgi:hypothetical protein